MTKKFKQNLFIVEGSTDKHFMERFIKLFIAKERLNIAPDCYTVEIIDEEKQGGKSNFFNNNGVNNIVKNIKKYSDDENLPKTFLIVDADWEAHHKEHQPAGYSNVFKELEKLQDQIKNHNFIKNHYAFKQFEIDHFIMPFNKETQEYGELETLFINALKPEYQNKLNCLDALEDCLKQKAPKPDIQSHHKDKMRMEILLKYYNKTMAKAIEWIDYESEILQDLKDFLRKKLTKTKSKNKK
ncbi:hypothetical protein LBMAG18_04650 [Alphaproteobacteria bacterium]|nr:hypothetical protein LBMAG18_04650 [Alphaproteobacteria bacterium]